MIRFLHAADLHLGLRLARFNETAAKQIAGARFVALENLKKAAIDRGAQFILIAGDVFDSNDIQAALAERAFAFFEGSQWPGPVCIIPGNHDPLSPGSVWDRDPWRRDQPQQRVRILCEAEPVQLPNLPVTLFPCPLKHRTSTEDPTRWIGQHPRGTDDRIRIGLAHGSLNILPQLPEDDHLIPADAADELGLDYLALGHWHKPRIHNGRTAYCGTHEPFHFPEETAGRSIGWEAYSSDGGAERFADAGRGVALFVEIDRPGAMPRIEEVEIGHLRWVAQRVTVTGRTPGELTREYSRADETERTLLRLTLNGVLSPQEHRRLGELREIIGERYKAGSSFDDEAVRIDPSPEELQTAIGIGVLPRVLERLRAEAAGGDADRAEIAELALKYLYQLVWEDRPA